MFLLRHAARTARRKTSQSTRVRNLQSTSKKILSLADITFRYLLTHQRDAVIVVAGFSKQEKEKSSALELAHTFGRWQFIFAMKSASRIEKYRGAIEDLLGLSFTPAALIGFEKMLSRQAEPIVADIEKKIASTEGPVHADETYWTLDGSRAYYWVHTTEDFVHFEFETTRSGQVSRDVLGEDFAGTLVTTWHAQRAIGKN